MAISRTPEKLAEGLGLLNEWLLSSAALGRTRHARWSQSDSLSAEKEASYQLGKAAAYEEVIAKLKGLI